MKRRVGKISVFLGTCSLLLLCLMIPQNALASEKTGSLIVYYHGVTPQGNQVMLSGAEFSLYKVGEKVENRWKLQGDFEKSGVCLEDMSSSGQKKAAEQLKKFVDKEKLEGKRETAGQDGKAIFYDLEESMYLCFSDDEVAYDTGRFRSAPFLVFIPEIDENGNCLYDVRVEPKNEWVSGDKPEEPGDKPGQNTESTPSKGENAKTGDNAPVELLVKIIAVSVIMIVLLMFWRNRGKRDEEQSNE